MNGFKSKITFINLSNYDIYKFIATTIFGCWCFDFEFGFELMALCQVVLLAIKSIGEKVIL